MTHANRRSAHRPEPLRASLRLDTGAHTDCVCQLVLSPDGKLLASAGECSIRLWSTERPAPPRLLLGHVAARSEEVFGDGNVVRLVFSHDGRWLLALREWFGESGHGRPMTELQVFDIGSGNLRSAFLLPGVWRGMALDPEGRHLALAGEASSRTGRSVEVRVCSLAAVVRAGFETVPPARATLRLGRAGRDATLSMAVAFVPTPGLARYGARLVVAAAAAAGGSLSELHWLRVARDGGLASERVLPLDHLIAPATLAVSARRAVVGSTGGARADGRFGLLLVVPHDGEREPDLVTESPPASAAFSPSGQRLVVGLSTDDRPAETARTDATDAGPRDISAFSSYAPAGQVRPAPEQPSRPPAALPPPNPLRAARVGEQTVQVNVYADVGGALVLHSTYYGHDDDVGAVVFAGEDAVLSSGGDNHAIHLWDARFRVGELGLALRGTGRVFFEPGVTPEEVVMYGTVPPRTLPPSHPRRQQSFDLRALSLKTTCPSDVYEADFKTEKWAILTLAPGPTIPLRSELDPTSPDLPPDLSLLVTSDDEWVLSTRSGYYAASAGGARHVGYHVSRGRDKEALFVPSDRFDVFNRRDIVRAVVDHGSEALARAAGVEIPELDVAAVLPPLLELTREGTVVHGSKVTFTFSVQTLNPELPVHRLWILRNDRFVWSERSPRRTRRARYRVTLPLLPGRNLFSLRAENRDAGWSEVAKYARAVPVDVELQGPPLPAATDGATVSRRGQLFLLSVGVSDFLVADTPQAQGFQRLQHAHDDAAAVVEALAGTKSKGARHEATGRRSGSRKTWPRNAAFERVHTRLLVNQEATREAILDTLGELCDRIRERSERPGAERDVLMVFLSGHGTRFKGESDLYFWNWELNKERLDETGLSLIELGALATSVPAEVVLVIDACHSGMAGADVVEGLDPDELAQRMHAVNERGMYVLSASRAQEKARESATAGHGVFTAALLQALRSPQHTVARGDGTRSLSMMALMSALQQLVPEISARGGHKLQTPVCRMYGDLLPLTIYRA